MKFSETRVSDVSMLEPFQVNQRRKLAIIEVYEGDLAGTYFLLDGRTLHWRIEGIIPTIIEGEKEVSSD